MQTVQVGPDNWENITPTQLAAQLRSVQPLRETVLRGENMLPTTFLFKTREGGMGILQITGYTDNPRCVKIRYKLVQNEKNKTFASPNSASEPADLRLARARLAELRVDYNEQNPEIQRQLARIKELGRLSKEEPDLPADLREAKVHLVESRVAFSEQNPEIQKQLARIKELERLSKEEPDLPADLREAKVHLAESRVAFSEQNPEVQRQLARIKELERLSKEDPNASAELREAKAHLAELRVAYSDQHPEVQRALARIKALEQK
jgi:chromosome segregation ATPase